MSRRRVPLTAGILAVLLAGAVLFVLWDGALWQHDYEMSYHHELARRVFGQADRNFQRHITLVVRTGEDGRGRIEATIDEELDSLLGDLAYYYSSDPETTVPVTEGELRHWLTDGIVEACLGATGDDPLSLFLLWTWAPAKLTSYRDPENPVPARWESNYFYVMGRADGPYKEPIFEYMLYYWEDPPT
jgi:hypothetical protein